MKEITRKNMVDLPYSLHDAHINKMKIKDTNLMLYFDEGYYVPVNGDTVLVKGYLELNEVELDCCNVYIMNMDRNYRKFKGKRYSLKKFMNKYPEIDMEIIDETYGYNQSKFSGFMYKGKKNKEFMMEVYHFGDMKYITYE
jgi:hypothetical protein